MNSFLVQTTGHDPAAWNQAHDRVRDFLNAFVPGDHAQVSRLTLQLLDQAREQHRRDPSVPPVSLAVAQAQKLVAEWLVSNLNLEDQPPSRLFASGYVAVLLSQAFRTAPETFLVSPLPANLKESMRETLLITGPDLKISSMTPRHIDYGPMLDLAQRTWHCWNAREITVALLFWSCVYFVFYWWLSGTL
ncbi:MAG TPA: hypothetical protein VL981_03280 [Candidatus Methylacidiphilales bacterium]|nr:hypothetical protein [Candidatus Methylacidiphilales bacterium]